MRNCRVGGYKMFVMKWMLALAMVSGTWPMTTVQPCADLDTVACQKLQAGQPDLCTNSTIGPSACASFCNLCNSTKMATTTVKPTTTPLPVVTSTCDDIDTSACHLMAMNKADLCMDDAIAERACKRFCQRCPLICYNCSSVMDYHECKQTVECKTGELCMIKELHSFLDNHVEFQMTCEPRQRCDGGDLGLSAIVGRRAVSERDLSVTCCADDLCNYPEKRQQTTLPPTKPVTNQPICRKDVIFVVGGSALMNRDEQEIISFISDVIQGLHIGPKESLVSMSTISRTPIQLWDLNRYDTKADLIAAVKKQLHVPTHTTDIDDALTYIKNYATTTKAGDRPNADDVIVLLLSDDADDSRKTNTLANQLHQISNDVIRITLGSDDVSGHVATDSKHDLQVRHSSDLDSLTKKVLTLICQ